jgi:hypothetical protein
MNTNNSALNTRGATEKIVKSICERVYRKAHWINTASGSEGASR